MKPMLSCPRVHHSFRANKRRRETLLDLRTNNGSFFEQKENAIKTFIHAFEWLTFTYPADVLFCFFLVPTMHQSHSDKRARATNQLKAIQLSGGNHKMSMLTKLKYYPPIWVLFINIEMFFFFPCGRM